MHPTIVGLAVFACCLAGALIGQRVRPLLPRHHLDESSREVMKLGIGLIATMTALVLGLITASAKSSFDAMDAAVKNSGIDLLTLDRLLARYGPETGEIRAAMKRAVGERMEMVWPSDSSHTVDLDPFDAGLPREMERLADAIRGLQPHDDLQRALQARALGVGEGLLQHRWLITATGGTSIPTPFLVVLLFWLTATFASFGLLAPGNSTVFAVLFVCALSVGSAVFLILEMDGPFDGVLKISPDPMRYAHEHLAR